MHILSVNKSPAAEKYSKRNLPVPRKKHPRAGDGPMAHPQESSKAPMPDNDRRRVLVRATAPFLAQLSAQYDEVNVLSKARRDRIGWAAESYASANARVIVPVAGKQHDFKS